MAEGDELWRIRDWMVDQGLQHIEHGVPEMSDKETLELLMLLSSEAQGVLLHCIQEPTNLLLALNGLHKQGIDIEKFTSIYTCKPRQSPLGMI
jgi:hypothetical protein